MIIINKIQIYSARFFLVFLPYILAALLFLLFKIGIVPMAYFFVNSFSYIGDVLHEMIFLAFERLFS